MCTCIVYNLFRLCQNLTAPPLANLEPCEYKPVASVRFVSTTYLTSFPHFTAHSYSLNGPGCSKSYNRRSIPLNVLGHPNIVAIQYM